VASQCIWWLPTSLAHPGLLQRPSPRGIKTLCSLTWCQSPLYFARTHGWMPTPRSFGVWGYEEQLPPDVPNPYDRVRCDEQAGRRWISSPRVGRVQFGSLRWILIDLGEFWWTWEWKRWVKIISKLLFSYLMNEVWVNDCDKFVVSDTLDFHLRIDFHLVLHCHFPFYFSSSFFFYTRSYFHFLFYNVFKSLLSISMPMKCEKV
jgi:hypothetical protein